MHRLTQFLKYSHLCFSIPLPVSYQSQHTADFYCIEYIVAQVIMY